MDHGNMGCFMSVIILTLSSISKKKESIRAKSRNLAKPILSCEVKSVVTHIVAQYTVQSYCGMKCCDSYRGSIKCKVIVV